MEVAVIKLDSEILIVIQNSRKNRSINPEEIFNIGYSTKGINRGIGLNNVKEILEKYDDVILETEIDDERFKQIIRFKRNII